MDYDSLLSKLPSLLKQLADGLSPLGTLNVLALPPPIQKTLSSALTAAGFDVLSDQSPSGAVIAQKPALALGGKNISEVSLTTTSTGMASPVAVAVPLRLRKKDNAAKKAALWAITSSAPSTPLIDPESLLTEADKQRPVPVCEPLNPSAPPRRKKACKGCTCGLAELEEEERRTTDVVVLDGLPNGETKIVKQSEKERLVEAARNSTKATSSCGSCFLGDAFRCAGCPYRGKTILLHFSGCFINWLFYKACLHSSLEKRFRSVSIWMISRKFLCNVILGLPLCNTVF